MFGISESLGGGDSLFSALRHGASSPSVRVGETPLASGWVGELLFASGWVGETLFASGWVVELLFAPPFVSSPSSTRTVISSWFVVGSPSGISPMGALL